MKINHLIKSISTISDDSLDLNIEQLQEKIEDLSYGDEHKEVVRLRIELSKKYFFKENYRAAIETLSLCEGKIRGELYEEFLALMVMSAKNLGLVYLTERFGIKLLERLLKRKRIEDAKTVLGHLEDLSERKGKYLIYKIKVDLIEGNINGLNAYLHLLEDLIERRKFHIVNYIYDSLATTFQSKLKFYKKSKFILALIASEKLSRNHGQWQIEFIKCLIELSLVAPDDYITHLLQVNYSIKEQAKELGLDALKNLKIERKMDNERILIETMLKSDRYDNMKYDFATDLFERGKSALQEFDEIKRLEHEYYLAKDLDNKKLKLEILKKIEEIDPENHLIKELGEVENETRGSRLFEIQEGIDNTERFLNNKFKSVRGKNYTSSNKEQIILKKSIEALGDNDLALSFKDIIISLNMMNMHSLSMSVVKRMKDIAANTETAIEVRYLEVSTLFEMNEYYSVLDTTVETFEKYPLLKEEKVDFLYIYAEALRKIGRRKESVECYLAIKEISPNYRLVRQRLKSFEKN